MTGKIHTGIALLLLMPSLRAQPQQEELPVETVVQVGHTYEIISYDISLDGRYLISLDRSHKVLMWDIASGRQIREYTARLRDGGVRKVSIDKRRNNRIYLSGSSITDIYDIKSNRRIGILNNSELDGKTQTNDRFTVIPDGTRMEIRDSQSEKLISKLRGYATEMGSLAVTAGGQQLLVSNERPVMWDLKQGKPAYRVDEPNEMKICFSPDEKHFLTSSGGKLTFRRTADGEADFSISMPQETKVNAAAFNADGTKIVLATTMDLYEADVPNRQLKPQKPNALDNVIHNITAVITCPGGNDFIAGRSTWNIYKGAFDNPFALELKRTLGSPPLDFSFSPSQDELISCGAIHNMKEYTFPDMRLKGPYLQREVVSDYDYRSCCYVTDELVAGGGTDGNIYLFDAKSRAFLKSLTAHKASVVSIRTSPDRSYFYSSSVDGTVCMWNARTHELIATLVALGDELDYVIVTPDNYYMASKNAFQGIHFVKGTQVFGFDQFDLQYNRPDIVLSRLGYSLPDQISLFRRGYEKRLRKMNFTEDMFSTDFHIPSAKILNKAALQKTRTDNKATLEVLAADDLYKLNRINVWVNNVPVYGVQGIAIDGKEGNEINRKIELSLASGANLVEVSCLNEHGVESYRDQVELVAPESRKKPDMHIFSIGVSEFADSSYNLDYAHKDATDVAGMFGHVNRHNFANVYTHVLVNRDVTRSGIVALKEKLKNASVDDVVVVFYAGHGVLDRNFDYFLATYDTDFSSPEKQSLPYEELENMLDGITPLKKILLVDACHSGEIDKEEVMLADASATREGTVKFRDVGIKVRGKETHESAEINQLLKLYFADLQRGVGATVISSSSGLEVSMEGDDWKNGLFTYVLKEGILNKKADENKDGTVTVSEMQLYTNREVSKISSERQQPSSRVENKQLDFVIAYGYD
ncbi:MAG: caspase family protein [Tannerella sp.]|jgi:WD40 repeat protein|nr:caspase family protein [Tannerella sp.]